MTFRAPRWTAEDVRILRNLAGKYSKNNIALFLGRGPSAIGGKALRLGISLRVKRRLRPRDASEISRAR